MSGTIFIPCCANYLGSICQRAAGTVLPLATKSTTCIAPPLGVLPIQLSRCQTKEEASFIPMVKTCSAGENSRPLLYMPTVAQIQYLIDNQLRTPMSLQERRNRTITSNFFERLSKLKPPPPRDASGRYLA